MKAILTLNRMPKTCDECPLFVRGLGNPAHCRVGAEYSAEEIAKVKDGNLTLYYHGCLSKKPANCPLKAESCERDKNEEIDKIMAYVEKRYPSCQCSGELTGYAEAVEDFLQFLVKFKESEE